ncbi:MAG: hypothetical protein H6738_12910 [Alphaproteobacteria bacterium]|nr:hypothetical protein [Alphaproteobacteria bacterium]MCB9697675.1 hypothetical protein [Alphaproteobacteria bacterium]
MSFLLPGLDPEKLDSLQRTFSDRLRTTEPGSRNLWPSARALLNTQYCAVEDLGTTRRRCIDIGLSILDAGNRTNSVLLMELWGLAWQQGDPALLRRVARSTRKVPDAFGADRQYQLFVEAGTLPSLAPPSPDGDPDIGRAVALPVIEARALVLDVTRCWMERARRQPTTGRRVAMLGPLVWMRGVAWARYAISGEDIVPAEVGSFFYDWPHQRE